MKVSAIVLRNERRPVGTVGYAPVLDALLSGGVYLSEVVLLPYDDGEAIDRSLARLSEGGDVLFVCDGVLLDDARAAVSRRAGREMEGLFLETDRLFAVLPAGEEGARAAKETLIPAIDRRRQQSYHSIVFRTVGAPSETLRDAVREAVGVSEGKLEISAHAEDGAGRVEIVYDRLTPKVICDEAVRLLAEALKPYLYAMEDVTPAERLFDALKLHRLRVSTAESFTGGGVGAAIVSIPGASTVFYEGINAYDEKAKTERLGVSEYTLKSKGAVSSETAFEMAAGLIKGGHCDLAIATTGIAGPDSDRTGAPAGLCYLAVGTKERVRVFEFHLKGDRRSVTAQAVNLALFLAYKEINGNNIGGS